MAAGKRFTADSITVTGGTSGSETVSLNLTGLGDFSAQTVTLQGGTAPGTAARLNVIRRPVFVTMPGAKSVSSLSRGPTLLTR